MTGCIWPGGTARTEWIATPSLACAAEHAVLVGPERVDPLGPPLAVAVAEPQLRAGQRLGGTVVAQPAGQVAGVDQGDPHPGLRRRLDQRPPHLVLVRVRDAAGAVMQVVELAHAGDPGQRHFRVHGPGQRQVAVRLQPRGHLVHPLPPGPERSLPGLGGAAEGAVERMGVGVGQARQGEPGQPHRARGDIGRGGRPGRTAMKRSPAASMSTPGRTPPAAPGSQARLGDASARGHAGVPGQRHARSSSTAASAPHPGRAVGRLGVLGGRVRDPGRVAHEQHRGRHPRRQHSRVVARAGRQQRRRDALLPPATTPACRAGPDRTPRPA